MEDPEVDRKRCDLCDVKFTSHEHSISHYEGKKHKKKTCDAYAYANSMKSRNPRFQQNYCHFCKIQVSGPAPMKQHKESARHIKKVQESKSRQSSDADSSTSSPPGSVYNEFQMRPDSTIDNDEFIQENLNMYSHRGSITFQPSPPGSYTGPMTLQSSPPVVHTGPLQYSPPLYMQDPLQPAELAAKLNDMQIQEIKNQLMEPCKKLIQEEVEKLIPVLAEKLIDMTMESLRRAGMQQEAMKQSPGHEIMMADTTTSYGPFTTTTSASSGHFTSVTSPGSGPFTTSASSVCNQLFPSGQNKMAPTPMNGHHSFAGSGYLKPGPKPPPGFDRMDPNEIQNQF